MGDGRQDTGDELQYTRDRRREIRDVVRGEGGYGGPHPIIRWFFAFASST